MLTDFGGYLKRISWLAMILMDYFRLFISDMRYMLDGIFERAGVIRNQKIEQKKQLTDRIANTENSLIMVTREMKLKIHNMVEEVEQKVSKALNEEIWRLGVLVDEFNLPFHTEPLVLNVYKKEINAHVETGLGSNLRARLSTALAMNVETAQREMTGESKIRNVFGVEINRSLLCQYLTDKLKCFGQKQFFSHSSLCWSLCLCFIIFLFLYSHAIMS